MNLRYPQVTLFSLTLAGLSLTSTSYAQQGAAAAIILDDKPISAPAPAKLARQLGQDYFTSPEVTVSLKLAHCQR